MSQPASRIAVATIGAANYLAHMRVLAASLRARHPDVAHYALVVDPRAELDCPGVITLRPPDLGVPGLQNLLFRSDVQQACSVLKPWLLRRLLDQGHAGALFLDPDMLALGDLSGLLEEVARNAVCLTPHRLHPPTGSDRIALELRTLMLGVMNGGLVGVSGRAPGRAFLDWWGERLLEKCENLPERGLFYCQRWLDLAPSLFENVRVLRDPGLNVAYWNLGERQVAKAGQGWRCGSAVCRLMHFSGFDPQLTDRITRHAELTLDDAGAAGELYWRYGEQLKAAGYAQARRQPYGYDFFDDGAEIPPVVRRIYREEPGRERFGDPFAAGGAGNFRNWLDGPSDGGTPAIPRLWRRVYDLRSGLIEAFPDIGGRDRDRFLQWVRRVGRAEHKVPAVIAPLKD